MAGLSRRDRCPIDTYFLCSAKVTAYATGYGRRLSSLPAPGRSLTAYATSYG